MNVHVPKEVQDKWPVLEFRGKRWSKDGFTWITVYHKLLECNLRYCFELDCAVESGMYEHICKHGYFG
jgi:hypothetical protein